MPFIKSKSFQNTLSMRATAFVVACILPFGAGQALAQQNTPSTHATTTGSAATLALDSPDPNQIRVEAEAGSSKAQYQLGMLYCYGSDALNFKKNRNEAIVWLRKAAEQGLFDADLELARIRITRYKKAEPVNWQPVIALWETEATTGSHEAQANLGFLYAEGIGVEANGEQTVRWCNMAVQSDPTNHQPMFILAKLYRDGKLVPANASLAFEWMEKAAKTGYGWAQLRLAEMYADGIGTKQNFAEAIKWAEKAEASGIGKDAKTASQRYQQLAKRPNGTKFEIPVAGQNVAVIQIGTGPIGVIIFGHTGVSQMNTYLLDNFEWLENLATEKCTFFLWKYPKSAPFDQINATLETYRAGDHSVRLAFPGIATEVVSQIQQHSGLNQFLVIGNSLGTGLVIWDYSQLVENKSLSFLLISPTEAFLPPLESVVPFSRTMLIGSKGLVSDTGEIYARDPWLKGDEALNWVSARRNDPIGDLITAGQADSPRETRTSPDGRIQKLARSLDFSGGHKTIGNEITAELLAKLIQVQLGIADKKIIAEPPKQL